LKDFDLGDFAEIEAFGPGEGFETLAPFESINALDEALAGAFELDFLAAGRAGDRLAAARRCFGMQSWPASLALDSSKTVRDGSSDPHGT